MKRSQSPVSRSASTRASAIAVKTIVFTDHFQDFLEWDLNAAGNVVACRPFQGSIWCDARVTNHASLRKGSIVEILIHGRHTNIRYPLLAVKKPGATVRVSKHVLNSKVVTRGAKALLADLTSRERQ